MKSRLYITCTGELCYTFGRDSDAPMVFKVVSVYCFGNAEPDFMMMQIL